MRKGLDRTLRQTHSAPLSLVIINYVSIEVLLIPSTCLAPS